MSEGGRTMMPYLERQARFALLVLLGLVIVLFSVLEPDAYFTVNNLRTIALTQAVLGVLAIATMLPLITGNFDVSVAANLGVGGVLVTGLTTKSGLPALLAIPVVIAICAGISLFNGVLVAKGRMNPFIVTLGVSTILSGAVVWYADGQILYKDFPPLVHDIGSGNVLGLPYPVLIVIVVCLVFWYLLEHTPLGRYMYAVGSSADAARLSGLNVTRLTLVTFALSGALCGVAGIMQAGELGAGDPTVGPHFLLPAFASVFLGAACIKLGSFNVLGTMIAICFLAAGVTGLVLVGVSSYVQPIFEGTALIVGVGLVRFLRRRDADVI
jgi:ribose transport system permease protein